jgi:hypothetical protein
MHQGPTLDSASVVPTNQLEAMATKRAVPDTIFQLLLMSLMDRQSKIAMKLPHGATQVAQNLTLSLERHACHSDQCLYRIHIANVSSSPATNYLPKELETMHVVNCQSVPGCRSVSLDELNENSLPK